MLKFNNYNPTFSLMKFVKHIGFSLLVILFMTNCKKAEIPEIPTGKVINVVFFNNENDVGSITVDFGGGVIEDITQKKNASSCPTNGCANFSLSEGRWNYVATATTGESWSDKVDVDQNSSCITIELD